MSAIVDAYIREAAPIASEAIARNSNLGVSPATIRNEVAALENEGYLTRPHPSAGSVPLDKAYRAYVESVASVGMKRIPVHVQDSIRKRLIGIERDIDEWASVAAALLAGLVGNLAIATFPKAPESRVRHIELVSFQELLTLLVVVIGQATLKRQLIRLREPVEAVELEKSTQRLSSLLRGHGWREVDPGAEELSPLEEDVLHTTIVLLKEEERVAYRDHYVDGLRNLLDQPEFGENEKVRAVVESVEDGSLAQAVLEETPNEGVVRVVIGRENRGNMLRPLSVVIGQYGVRGGAVGAIGAVGPVRMEYAKTIASVELMAGMMSTLVEGVQGGWPLQAAPISQSAVGQSLAIPT